MRRACYSLVAASNAPAALDPTAVATDSLLRVNKPGQTIAPEVRQEVTRILVRSGKNGEVSQDDRTYLASVVSANTGLSQQDAEKRVSGCHQHNERGFGSRTENWNSPWLPYRRHLTRRRGYRLVGCESRRQAQGGRNDLGGLGLRDRVPTEGSHPRRGTAKFD